MKKFNHLIGIIISVLLLVSLGCERSLEGLQPASAPIDGNVFRDGFSGGLEYSAFGGSDVTAFTVVEEGAYEGTSVMKFSVPDFDDPKGSYAGGAFTVPGGRDLTPFNVLTFWARASQAANINILGFGNDLGENNYVATITNTPVNTNWRKYYIPIPDPSKLTQEGGMFFYSEGPENGTGYTFWIDEVQFETLGTIALQSAAAFNGADSTTSLETGATFSSGGFADFNLPNGINQRVEIGGAYFDYTTSDALVATINPFGVVTAMDAGSAFITAKLGEKDADGSLTVNSTGEAVLPQTAAPDPTQQADDVVSIYSDAYVDEPIEFLNGFWEFSTTQSTEIQVAGNNIFRYSQLNFVGIQFANPTIDVSGMSHFHMDMWTPDPTALPAAFKILLVDLGADGVFEGNDDTSHEITLNDPTLQTEQWISLDIPLSDFIGLRGKTNLAQIVLSGDLPNVFVDNIYFYDDGTGGSTGGGENTPSVAAPAPTVPEADVKSIFSDAYTDEPIDFLNGFWIGSTTQSAKVAIQGDTAISYTQLNFVGIEFQNPTIDATEMTHFHVDLWSPDPTDAGRVFKVLLRDFGPNGVFDESGDDTFHELVFTAPVLKTKEWISLDIPLTDFVGLTNRANLAQIVFSGDLPNVFADNIYFYKGGNTGGGDNKPTTPAATPTKPASDVKSLFSDAYTDEPLDFINGFWGGSTTQSAKITVQGDSVIQYTELNFVGIQFTNPTIDVNEMTHVHVDIWTPDATNGGQVFRVKLRDFGPNGVFDEAGDDTEHELTFTSPTLQSEQWISLDLPLSDFTGLTTKGNMAQFILSGDLPNVFVDNVYFYK
ncbi:MAG: hypothetical protein AAFU33_20985 [Bacteroidota bacterium]